MNGNILGLCRVVCYDADNYYSGKQVTISNGTNSWKATVTSRYATFLIPSLPAPARKTFSLSVSDGSSHSFSTSFRLGYGDDKEIYLSSNYNPVYAKDITSISKISTLESKLPFSLKISGNNYGYMKGSTFVPFKTGAESFCYYLGAGTSYDIKSICATIKSKYNIDIAYTSLSNANFAVTTTTMYTSYNGGGGSGFGDFRLSTEGSSTYNAPTVSYNSATGALTIGAPTILGECKGYGGGASGAHASNANTGAIKTYLIKQLN